MYGTGKAKINIEQLTAGSTGTWIITYEVGEYGIDDSGEILIARRDVCDSDIPQFEDSLKPGYVKVYGDVDARLGTRYVPDRYIRPWKSCISIKVSDGSLKPGDIVYIQYGADEGEGLGYRIQTFAETEHIFKVLVDCAGSGNFYELDKSPYIKIVGGYADNIEVVAPSTIQTGEYFNVFVRVLDSWGNISSKYNSEVKLGLNGIEKVVKVNNGLAVVKNNILDKNGTFYFEAYDGYYNLKGISNPVVCHDSLNETLFWGDMHGQTKETVGTGTLDEYFTFARDKAWLDFCAWQGNDFQVTYNTWDEVCKKTKDYHDSGKFVTFLGYEWSGTTPAGGDYNIYYLKDDQPIYRSYHWQIGMEQRDGTERNPITKLWDEFRGRNDVMAVPHVGGRYGNLDFCDMEFVKMLEIHSHHGTFEWFYDDALKRGLKLGILAASDDHTCRPGLSYPTRKTSRGFVSFDVIGGYTGVYAEKLTRESLWEAFRKRHTYGTTGRRIILDVRCGDKMMGDEFSISSSPEISINVKGMDILSEIELMRGRKVIYRYSDTLPVKDDTIKIQWSGVRIKSRSKKTNWNGKLCVKNGRIKKVVPFAFNQPEEGVTLISNQIVEWVSNTSGDIDGFELELDYDDTTELLFNTEPVKFSIKASDLKEGKIIKNAGGINQKVEVGLGRYETRKQADILFKDKLIDFGLNPYRVKVIQRDGHMAWSSPMFINFDK